METLERVSHARVLIIDDEPGTVDVLREILEAAGFTRIDSTTDPRRAASLYLQLQPDVILLDLHMPQKSGLQVLRELRRMAGANYLPILVLTGDLSPDAWRKALSSGAKDFLHKPFRADEVLLRVRTLLQTRFLYLQIQSQQQFLEARVRDRTRELEITQMEVMERLARAAEFRDDTTGQHTERVGELAARLAKAIDLPEAQVALIRRAAPLHDVGKLGVPDSILLKRGRLTEDEFALVKTHTRIGAQILSGSRFPLLQLAQEIASSHHERWDGSGYEGQRRSRIPLAGRIVAIADVFDALTHQRPYKDAWTIDDALGEMERHRGRQFDPKLVDAFLRIVERDPVMTRVPLRRTGASPA